MSTVQDVIGNYTPLSNNVVAVLKLVKGAVACKIFFTSNLEDRICRMGLTRIANELGIDRSTASKAISALIKDGYVERTKKATHIEPAHYRCTQKFYDLAQGVDVINRGVDVINRGVDVINRGVDVINQEEDIEEDTKELSSTNVEDVPQKTTTQNNNQPIKEEKEKVDVSPQPDPTVSPPPVKPKTIIKDRFCELAKKKMPKNKKQSGYWWAQFGELLYIANDDYELACKALDEVVPYMRAQNLSISGPQSVIGLCGEVISGQKLNGNTITTEIAPGQDEKWSGLF